jgi:hypothetical protein
VGQQDVHHRFIQGVDHEGIPLPDDDQEVVVGVRSVVAPRTRAEQHESVDAGADSSDPIEELGENRVDARLDGHGITAILAEPRRASGRPPWHRGMMKW